MVQNIGDGDKRKNHNNNTGPAGLSQTMILMITRVGDGHCMQTASDLKMVEH